MNTIDLVVGKKYIIEGFECEITKQGQAWQAVILSGDKKGFLLSDTHGGFCKPLGNKNTCSIHGNSGCKSIIEL